MPRALQAALKSDLHSLRPAVLDKALQLPLPPDDSDVTDASLLADPPESRRSTESDMYDPER